jgi:DNA repair exonuclease SbcCD ATPase subunit
MIPYGETTSPGFSSQSQSDDSEREDGALTHQIAILTVKNNSLQKQLNERELERDRLREQLELQRQERNSRTPYSPTGLPSRLLDGRKVLRDSISGLATGSGGPTPVSPSAHSPTTTHSPRFRTPASGGTVDPGRKGFLDTFATELMASAERLQMENNLKRMNADLERHLREVTEENKYLEHELQKQKEAFAKMQVREQDLSKDIEILRDENSHHTGAINKLKTERDGLQTENDTLHEELHAVTEKLNKTEKCYKEVEHENVSLEAEIDQLMSDKKQLSERSRTFKQPWKMH